MILCFDIGGTSIKYGVADQTDGQIRFEGRWETPTNAKTLRGPGIERRVLELIGELRGQYAADGVAISTAGMVDPESGAIAYANENIPDYTGRNLRIAVEQAYGLPCAVENDVNCAALGEAAYGAGRGADSVFCITVGTGIGGAVVLDGKVVHGHCGSAGEIGYMPVGGRPFQDQASTTALVERVRAATGETLDGRQIFARAQAGDTVCADAIDALCDIWAQGIAVCMSVINPAVVVLGGGIMAQQDYLRPRIEAALARYANPYVSDKTTLAFAELGNSAGMAGACYWLRQRNLPHSDRTQASV